MSGGVATNTGSGPDTPFRWHAAYRGPDGLYHFGMRDYDPNLKRFTQVDSIQQPADLRQANRYVYAGDDPVNATDPSGTDVTLSLDAFLPEGMAASIGIDDEGFPIHGGVSFGVGVGVGASLSFSEQGGGVSTGTSASYCALVYCGSGTVGFGSDGEMGTSGYSGWGLGLEAGVSYGISF